MSSGSSNPIGSIHIDNGVWSVGVIVAILAVAMLATAPVAGALVDDTPAPQQQTAVPDNNTTSTPESNATALRDASAENTTSNETATNATTADAVTALPGNTSESETAANRTAAEAGNGSSTVRFRVPNQTTNGSKIEVVAPRLPDGGFLVVHDSSFPSNGFGSTIGVSEYIAPNSSYSRVEVRLFDVPGRSFDQGQLRRSTTLYVRAALDTNDNQRYDHLATGGAQDVGYVVGGRQAVLSTQIDVDQPSSGSAPAAQYGINSTGSASSTATGDTESGSASANTSTSNSSNPISLGGSSSPIGAGNSTGNGSENGSSSVPVGAIGQQIGQIGPLLVLVSGGAIWMYFRHRS